MGSGVYDNYMLFLDGIVVAYPSPDYSLNVNRNVGFAQADASHREAAQMATVATDGTLSV